MLRNDRWHNVASNPRMPESGLRRSASKDRSDGRIRRSPDRNVGRDARRPIASKRRNDWRGNSASSRIRARAKSLNTLRLPSRRMISACMVIPGQRIALAERLARTRTFGSLTSARAERTAGLCRRTIDADRLAERESPTRSERRTTRCRWLFRMTLRFETKRKHCHTNDRQGNRVDPGTRTTREGCGPIDTNFILGGRPNRGLSSPARDASSVECHKPDGHSSATELTGDSTTR